MKIFYFLAFSIISLNTSYAASWATVISDKAVVYSDIQMTSKVGYLSKNKKIRIGDNTKNKGQLYPFLYKKKILYIKKEDIQTSSELFALSSVMERATEKSFETDPYQKISFGFNLGAYNFNSDEVYGGDEKKQLTFFSTSLVGYHIRPENKDAFKFLFLFWKGSDGAENFSLLNLELYYLFKLFKYKRLSLFAGPGVIYTPYFGYEFGSDFTKNGSGLGIGGEVDIHYRLTNKISLISSFNYRFQSLSVTLPNGVSPSEYEPILTAFSGSLAVAYRY